MSAMSERCNAKSPRDVWCSVHNRMLLMCTDELAAALAEARRALAQGRKYLLVASHRCGDGRPCWCPHQTHVSHMLGSHERACESRRAFTEADPEIIVAWHKLLEPAPAPQEREGER